MGERKRGVGHAEGGSNLCCASVKTQRRLSAGLADHLDLEPMDAPADPRSQGFCACLLGRKARRQAFGGLALAQTIGLLRSSEYAVEKPLTKPHHRLMNAANLDHTDPTANDHCEYQIGRAHV